MKLGLRFSGSEHISNSSHGYNMAKSGLVSMLSIMHSWQTAFIFVSYDERKREFIRAALFVEASLFKSERECAALTWYSLRVASF